VRLPPRPRREPQEVEDHPCCYYECPEPGAIHIGVNGGDSHWICFRHLQRWNQTRTRFLADGGGCEMLELGEPLERED
jgi:hypothetical protein